MKSDVSVAKLKEFITGFDSVLIFTHVRPDGDALGSSFALCCYLRSLGKKVDVMLPDGMPDRYNGFFVPYLRNIDKVTASNYQLFVALDCANSERLACGVDLTFDWIAEREFINIDHHPFNSIVAKRQLLDTDACSTCEIITNIICSNNESKIPTQVATYLLVGMMTDTGSFRFANTDGNALRSAAKLLDNGAELEKAVNTLFFSKSKKQLDFENELVREHLRFACDNRFAYAYISPELLEKYNFKLREDEGIIDILRGVAGVVIATLVYKTDDGKFRVSMRSKNEKFPVRPFALRHNGGGHAMAAGATIDLTTWEEVENLLIKEIGELLDHAE